MNTKRNLACTLTIILLTTMFSACGTISPVGEKAFPGRELQAEDQQSPNMQKEKLSVICTTFPQYDWVRQIIGTEKTGGIDLTLLLDSGIDLHSFQPSAEDIVKISECDLFIYVGGESDEWVEDALAQATNQNMVVLNLLESAGSKAKPEELVEGMEEEEGEEEAEGTLDEHVWLSLNLAEILCGKIKDALSSLDSAGEATYRSNLNTYIAELRALDEEYQTAADTAAVKTLLFGDRFPFRYLADDYGLDYYAAFPGCSAETEASFETILFLSEKLADLNLRCVMVTESSDQAIAKTIIGDNPDSKILVMDAMQSVTQSEVTDGATYLDIMRSNLNVLKEALQG